MRLIVWHQCHKALKDRHNLANNLSPSRLCRAGSMGNHSDNMNDRQSNRSKVMKNKYFSFLTNVGVKRSSDDTSSAENKLQDLDVLLKISKSKNNLE